mmetsp:Transcript_10583/g.24517  ORF Transcript_10583/g.24517 Transcript_10583/m.24517 type:complete len:204 (+) Transcript_10583:205-816(+)
MPTVWKSREWVEFWLSIKGTRPPNDDAMQRLLAQRQPQHTPTIFRLKISHLPGEIVVVIRLLHRVCQHTLKEPLRCCATCAKHEALLALKCRSEKLGREVLGAGASWHEHCDLDLALVLPPDEIAPVCAVTREHCSECCMLLIVRGRSSCGVVCRGGERHAPRSVDLAQVCQLGCVKMVCLTRFGCGLGLGLIILGLSAHSRS